MGPHNQGLCVCGVGDAQAGNTSTFQRRRRWVRIGSCLRFILLCDRGELPGHGPRGVARARLCEHQDHPLSEIPRARNSSLRGQTFLLCPARPGNQSLRRSSSDDAEIPAPAGPCQTDHYARSLSRRPSLREQTAPRQQYFSVPITFEPAIDSLGQAVQFVGHGKGMTVLLESSGIEIAIGNAPGATASANSVKLRLLNAAASRRLSNAIVSAPERRRKRRPNTTPPPRTRRSPNRRNMPHRDTPGHRGQAPRARRAPRQRVPRQTRPTGQLATPQGTDRSQRRKFRVARRERCRRRDQLFPWQ